MEHGQLTLIFSFYVTMEHLDAKPRKYSS